MRQVLLSNTIASAMIMAMRDACGMQPVLVLYGLGAGDSIPAGPEVAEGPGYGYVIGEAQCPDSDWTGVGGPWRRDNTAGTWVVTCSAVGDVAYARIIDPITRACHIQSDVVAGDPGPDGPAIWLDSRAITEVGQEVQISMVRLEVLQSAHLM